LSTWFGVCLAACTTHVQHRSSNFIISTHLHLLQCIIQLSLITRDYRHIRAALGEEEREREPQAGGAAGDIAVLAPIA
jgi:hypothetical protein